MDPTPKQIMTFTSYTPTTPPLPPLLPLLLLLPHCCNIIPAKRKRREK